MTDFIGRVSELKRLQSLLSKKSASLAVIKGRRRIGKSRLAQEFGKSFAHYYSFSGLAPTVDTLAKHQKAEFIKQLHQQRVPHFRSDDWSDLFLDLAQHCQKGKTLVLLDEISWLGHNDPTFLGKLKIAWDTHFKTNPHLVMILSGSQSTWIEKNIIKSTGFMGRISHQLTLEELSLPECNQFWRTQKNLVSPYEKFKLLAVTGGVPKYLEEININQDAETNIKNLCFEPEGLLFNEFDQIFTDLFSKRSAKYKLIVQHLAKGHLTVEAIARQLHRSKGGEFSESLDDLCQTGFVTRDYSWDIKNAQPSKLSHYRLSDNYLRFYLKCIKPNQKKISSGATGILPIAWLTHMGLQFENLVLSKNNRKLLFQHLNIPLEEIVWANPFFQTKTSQWGACQIDLLIHTKFNTLYVCEIKFSQNRIEKDVVHDMQKKISILKTPKQFSIRPVLIHVNGVHESVVESEVFSHILDFGDFLKTS